MKKTRLCDILGIEYPIIQGAMTWITWANLAAAVSNAGGLGTIGPNAGATTVTKDVAETGERLRRQIREAKKLTNKPFAVMFSTPMPTDPPEGNAFGNECIRVAIEEQIPIALTSGYKPEFYTSRLKAAGIKVVHKGFPSTVAAAKQAEEVGVDVFVAISHDAGGHLPRIPLYNLSLIPQIVDAVKIPVVAAGGIADARGFIAALALGAEGILMGTRFITTKECAAHPNMKQAIINATDVSTVTWSGALGFIRALQNPISEQCLKMQAQGVAPEKITEFYSGLLRVALAEGDMDRGVPTVGAIAGMIKEIMSAGDVVRSIVKDSDAILARLCSKS